MYRFSDFNSNFIKAPDSEKTINIEQVVNIQIIIE
jgi:hypothetical protein